MEHSIEAKWWSYSSDICASDVKCKDWGLKQQNYVFLKSLSKATALWKIKMEPESDLSEKENHLPNLHDIGFHVNFQGGWHHFHFISRESKEKLEFSDIQILVIPEKSRIFFKAMGL